MTANGPKLQSMCGIIKDECGVDTQQERFHIIGCEHVLGFEAVENGTKVDVEKVSPGIVDLALSALKQFPESRGFVLECTELPPYSNAIRKATGLPVFDAITNADFYMSGFKINKLFGINFQEEWDGTQEDYEYGQNLTSEQKKKLVNKAHKSKL